MSQKNPNASYAKLRLFVAPPPHSAFFELKGFHPICTANMCERFLEARITSSKHPVLTVPCPKYGYRASDQLRRTAQSHSSRLACPLFEEPYPMVCHDLFWNFKLQAGKAHTSPKARVCMY